MTTYDIVTIIISAVSLALSIGHIAYEIWKQQTKLNIQIDSTAHESLREFTMWSDFNEICVPCVFVNQSHSNVVIVRITAILENGYECTTSMQEQLVCHNFRKSVDTGTTFEKEINSTSFPVNLNSVQGIYGILVFKLPKQSIYNFSDVVVETNKKTVHLQELASDLTKFNRDSYNRYQQRYHSENTCDNLTVS